MTRTEYIAKLTKYLRKLPQGLQKRLSNISWNILKRLDLKMKLGLLRNWVHLRKPHMKSLVVFQKKRLLRTRAAYVNKNSYPWIAILAVLASPVALPILLFFLAMLLTLLLIIFAVIVTALALTFALLISGVYTFFTSFSLLNVSLASTLFGIGLGLLMFGGALLLLLISFEICKLIVKLITLLIKWLIKKGRKS